MLLIAASGCRHGGRKPLPTTNSSSVAASRKFEDSAHGFTLAIPDGWNRTPVVEDPQNVLELRGPGNAEVSVAVPKLPPHVPGLLPLGAVQNGYVSDVRKRWTNVAVQQEPETDVAEVPARLFVVAGTDKADKTGSAARKMQVLIFARGDTLFIVTGEGPADQFDAVKTAVERVADSWNWLKNDSKNDTSKEKP